MRPNPTLFLPVDFQQAVTVLLTVVPVRLYFNRCIPGHANQVTDRFTGYFRDPLSFATFSRGCSLS